MNSKRWIAVALLVSASTLSNGYLSPVFSDDKAKGGHNHAAEPADETKIKAAIAKLPEGDRAAAAAQRYCATMDTVRLGAMGAPVKVMIDGKPVFLCCKGCQEEAVEHSKDTLATVEKLKKAVAAIGKLPAADRPIAEAQLFCPIAKNSRLGSMGTPVKLMLEGKPVFLCCKGCEEEARANAKATLAKVEEIKKENAKSSHHHDHDH